MVASTSGPVAVELFTPAPIALLREVYDISAPQSDIVALKRSCASASCSGSVRGIYTRIRDRFLVSTVGGNRVSMWESTDGIIVTYSRGTENAWHGAAAAEVANKT